MRTRPRGPAAWARSHFGGAWGPGPPTKKITLFDVVNHAGLVGGAESVIDVDDADAGGAAVEHGQEGGESAEGGAVSDAGGDGDDGAVGQTGDDAGQGAFHAGDGDDDVG